MRNNNDKKTANLNEIKEIASKLTPQEREKMVNKFRQFEQEREQSSDQPSDNPPKQR